MSTTYNPTSSMPPFLPDKKQAGNRGKARLQLRNKRAMTMGTLFGSNEISNTKVFEI